MFSRLHYFCCIVVFWLLKIVLRLNGCVSSIRYLHNNVIYSKMPYLRKKLSITTRKMRYTYLRIIMFCTVVVRLRIRLTGCVTGVTGRLVTQRDEQDKFKSISASIFQVVLLQGGLFRQVTLSLSLPLLQWEFVYQTDRNVVRM